MIRISTKTDIYIESTTKLQASILEIRTYKYISIYLYVYNRIQYVVIASILL